jgi:predicted CopG family antitoxin
MPSTTIRLDEDILKKIDDIKPSTKSISAFVRQLIEREYNERELRRSAETYREFLQRNPEERRAMEEWESAPLVNEAEPPAP